MSTERPQIDPVTFEVIRHRLLSITDEQAAVLAAVSGSPLVNEATDFNTGLYLADGEVVTMGRTVILHAASLSMMVRSVIQHCGADPGIDPGDIFVMNHPYMGALHAPDFGVLAPIFHAGRRVGWTGACAHQLDVGGAAHGGFAPQATNVFQEGMLISPTKLVARGELRNDVLSMITGMSRMPMNMSLDFKGMIAANNIAINRMQETIARYGADVVLGVMQDVIDLSELNMRNRLRGLRDGIYRARTYLDHDGLSNALYKIEVALHKRGDRLLFDYTPSDDQAPGFVNSTRTGLMAGVYAGILPLLAFDLPWNEGIFRPVEIRSRSGSIVDAQYPAPVSQGPLGAMWLIEVVSTEVLSKLVSTSDELAREAQAAPAAGPDLFNVSGLNQYREPAGAVFLDQTMTGGGAYAHRDGLTAQGQHNITAGKTPNVETMELGIPLLYLYRKLIPDTAGPGRNRGGQSAGAAYMLHGADKLHALVACHGYESPNSAGMFGGYPSGCNRRLYLRNTNVREVVAKGEIPQRLRALQGEEVALEAKAAVFEFGPDDVYEWWPLAGGGWGDPLERDIERVAQDLTAGVISVGAARSIYGVVIDDDGHVDRAASAARRAEVRAERIGWEAAQRLATKPNLSKATHIAPMGENTELVLTPSGAFLKCSCGQAIAPSRENWKLYAAHSEVPAESLGPNIRLHALLRAHLYACPGCGRLLGVEVRRENAAPLHDIELEL